MEQQVKETQQKVVKKEAGTKEVTAKKAERVERRKPEASTQDRPRRQMNRKARPQKFESEYTEKVVDIARVTKVVKGGRRFSFSAFVVVGNKKGSVGYGHGKANEVPDAIKKAIKDAQNNLVNVPLVKGTIPHTIDAKFLASKVLLKPAPKGKGLIASGTVRAVVELAGYTDIVTKTYGSRSKANVVKATVKALQNLRTVEEIAELRDKQVKDFE
ncbi:30S ribosomal protein S5 [Mycoplasma nasistruthionis]|uniref:Small ribosomal subunit protein uS5 n=2 Tax=Mycoplasma nasistruthionis TaxID=353852 RepID=A0A4Y6I655_9MOLU|nr:30S ribosomal protein S5 [Mycoplasma nasistruthionis]QCZ36817.1 30S ribosomal protein S5 [Mycoplasma nasistruthionis]QDF65096.1 30S ribosomal protein S5 [Mycoplasma nasistruthionis]